VCELLNTQSAVEMLHNCALYKCKTDIESLTGKREMRMGNEEKGREGKGEDLTTLSLETNCTRVVITLSCYG